MAGEFREGHYLLGIEGLALLRAGARRSLDGVDARTEEIRGILARFDERPYRDRRDLPEESVGAGYAQWADAYDEPGNDTIALEEPVVQELLDRFPDGPVLDAACGTGRHAAHLRLGGRDRIVGVDASEAMLARARSKLPDVDFRHGELTALPLADHEVGSAVCALALSHLPEIGPAITALADAGFAISRCIEPPLTEEQAGARAKKHDTDSFKEALDGVPAVVVWEAERL